VWEEFGHHVIEGRTNVPPVNWISIDSFRRQGCQFSSKIRKLATLWFVSVSISCICSCKFQQFFLQKRNNLMCKKSLWRVAKFFYCFCYFFRFFLKFRRISEDNFWHGIGFPRKNNFWLKNWVCGQLDSCPRDYNITSKCSFNLQMN